MARVRSYRLLGPPTGPRAARQWLGQGAEQRRIHGPRTERLLLPQIPHAEAALAGLDGIAVGAEGGEGNAADRRRMLQIEQGDKEGEVEQGIHCGRVGGEW